MNIGTSGPRGGLLSNYIQCRMDPFTSSSGNGVPDSAMTRRIVVDHHDFCTLTVGASGSFQVRLFPTFPMPLAFKDAAATAPWSGYKVNGIDVSLCTAPCAGTAYNYGWMPMLVFNEWRGWSAGFNLGNCAQEATDPYGAMRARIVSFGVKVYYTGAAATAQGSLTTTSDRSSLRAASNVAQVIGAYNSIVASGVSINPALIGNLDFGATWGQMDSDSIMQRPEVPLRVVPRRLDETRPWVARLQTATILVDSSTTTSVFNLLTTSTSPVAVALYDDAWEIGVMSFNNIGVGSTFQFEVAMCVEYQPAVTSSFDKIAKKPIATVPGEKLIKTEGILSSQPLQSGAGKSVAGKAKQVADAVLDKPKPPKKKAKGKAFTPVTYSTRKPVAIKPASGNAMIREQMMGRPTTTRRGR